VFTGSYPKEPMSRRCSTGQVWS